jgi:hypothetical protein
MSITNGITDRSFRRYFSESSRTVHFPIVLLIVVLYRQNHRRIEKSSVFVARVRRRWQKHPLSISIYVWQMWGDKKFFSSISGKME